MQIGQITKVFNERGFGFIRSEEYPEGIFFHISEMADEKQFDCLKPGTSVSFNVENNEKTKRPMAINVEISKE